MRIFILIAMIINLTNAVAQTSKYPITLGTDRFSTMDTSSLPGERGDHGVRLGCSISHFSYDDPIIFPGKPDKAHLHVYWGNVGADAFSTGESLLNSGNSTCEGGVNNRSSYWMPALFDKNDEVVLAKITGLYYKTFGMKDYTLLNPIPNGLKMLASKATLNSGEHHLRIQNVNGEIDMLLRFPVCVALNSSGDPILSYRDMPPPYNTKPNSHVAYEDRSFDNGCPPSHKYRMPQLMLTLKYDIPYDSEWYLSSDMNSSMQGQTVHADYIAAWDSQSMAGLVKCNIEARRGCEFVEGTGRNTKHRWQLPERFKDVDGNIIYRTADLLPTTDRTPFGNGLKPMKIQTVMPPEEKFIDTLMELIDYLKAKTE